MLIGVQLADTADNRITIWLKNSNALTVPYIWLRDHCQCTECYHSETKQRLLETHKLPEEIEISSAAISPDGLTLTVQWENDFHFSEYDASLFENLREDPESLKIERRLWT